MAKGLVLPPNVVFSTSLDNNPEVELFVFGANPPAGQAVRITVYDEAMFRHGTLGGNYEAAFGVFAGFGAQVVPEPLRDAPSLVGDGGAGVLLVVDADVVGEVPARAVNNKKWAFSNAVATECAPVDLLAQVAFGLRDENNDRQFVGMIRLPRFNLASTRPLVMVVARLDTHEILFSNAWRSPAQSKNNLQGRPTQFHAKPRSAAFRSVVGGNGEGPGAPGVHSVAQPTYDHTGMYEVFLTENQLAGRDAPVMMLQLNQAGSSLAGWFEPPPTVNLADPQLSLPRPPALPPLPSAGYGVLLGFVESNDGAIHFNWGATDGPEDDPEPSLVKDGTGFLKELPHRAHWCEIAFRRGNIDRTLYIQRVDCNARWANRTMRGISQLLGDKGRIAFDVYRGRQAEPLPLRFFNRLQEDMKKEGTLGRLIDAARTAVMTDARRSTIEAIGTYFEGLLRDPRYRDRIVAHFLFLSHLVTLDFGASDGSGGGGGAPNSGGADGTNGVPNASGLPYPPAVPWRPLKKTCYQWICEVTYAWLTYLASDGHINDPWVQARHLPAGFLQMGIPSGNAYVYKIKFYALGGELPTIVKLGVYAFEARVTRYVVHAGGAFGPDVDDAWKDAGGVRQDDQSKELWGTFVDVGVSLSIKGLQSGASNMLSEVTFRTFHDLLPSDFAQVSFDVINGSGPDISALLLTASMATGTLVFLHLETRSRNLITLVGGTDAWMAPPDPKSPSPQVIKEPELISINAASLSMGTGRMSEVKPSAPEPVPPGQLPPSERDVPVQRLLSVYFRRAESSLEGNNLIEFQERLAVDKALFISGGGVGKVMGFASPEGPDNQGLTERRAASVMRAVQNTFGAELALKMSSEGRGSRDAEEAGLLPPDKADPALYREQEMKLFPQWRHVTMDIEGVVIFRLAAGKVDTEN